MKSSMLFFVFLLVLSQFVTADEGKESNSYEARYAYTMGYRIGQSLKGQGIKKLDGEYLLEGMNDVLEGRHPRLSDMEMNDAILSYQNHLKTLRKNDPKANRLQAQQFLAENIKKQGVKQLKSGLQYIVLKPGTGNRPTSASTVKVHYRGSFLNGEVFDSSMDKNDPVEFNLGKVIAGFRQAITNMQVGAKWKIFVPPSLGYGKRGVPGTIGPNELLIFELELIAISS